MINIYEKIIHGKIREAISLIKEGKVNINERKQRSQETPLYIAVEKGYIELAQALIDAKADIDSKDQHGISPLHIASMVKKLNGKNILDDQKEAEVALSFVKMLIEAGAKIDEQSIAGTPLYLAAIHKNIKAVQLLIESGAKIHLAAVHTNIKAVQLLIESGAKIHDDNTANIISNLGTSANNPVLIFAAKLSGVALDHIPVGHNNKIIEGILECNQNHFNSLQNNLKNIKVANIEKHNINQDKIYRIAIKSLLARLQESNNITELIELFVEKTSIEQMRAFNIAEPGALLTSLCGLKGDIKGQESKAKIPSSLFPHIVEYAGVFSEKRLESLLEAYFTEKPVIELGRLSPKNTRVIQGSHRFSHILRNISNLLDNCTEDILPRYIKIHETGSGREYSVLCEPDDRGAAMVEKPLDNLTLQELHDLSNTIKRELPSKQVLIGKMA